MLIWMVPGFQRLTFGPALNSEAEGNVAGNLKTSELLASVLIISPQLSFGKTTEVLYDFLYYHSCKRLINHFESFGIPITLAIIRI